MEGAMSVIIREDYDNCCYMDDGMCYTKSAPEKLNSGNSIHSQNNGPPGLHNNYGTSKSNSITDTKFTNTNTIQEESMSLSVARKLKDHQGIDSSASMGGKSGPSIKDPSGWHLLLLDDTDDTNRLFKAESHNQSHHHNLNTVTTNHHHMNQHQQNLKNMNYDPSQHNHSSNIATDAYNNWWSHGVETGGPGIGGPQVGNTVDHQGLGLNMNNPNLSHCFNPGPVGAIPAHHHHHSTMNHLSHGGVTGGPVPNPYHNTNFPNTPLPPPNLTNCVPPSTSFPAGVALPPFNYPVVPPNPHCQDHLYPQIPTLPFPPLIDPSMMWSFPPPNPEIYNLNPAHFGIHGPHAASLKNLNFNQQIQMNQNHLQNLANIQSLNNLNATQNSLNIITNNLNHGNNTGPNHNMNLLQCPPLVPSRVATCTSTVAKQYQKSLNQNHNESAESREGQAVDEESQSEEGVSEEVPTAVAAGIDDNTNVTTNLNENIKDHHDDDNGSNSCTLGSIPGAVQVNESIAALPKRPPPPPPQSQIKGNLKTESEEVDVLSDSKATIDDIIAINAQISEQSDIDNLTLKYPSEKTLLKCDDEDLELDHENQQLNSRTNVNNINRSLTSSKKPPTKVGSQPPVFPGSSPAQQAATAVQNAQQFLHFQHACYVAAQAQAQAQAVQAQAQAQHHAAAAAQAQAQAAVANFPQHHAAAAAAQAQAVANFQYMQESNKMYTEYSKYDDAVQNKGWYSKYDTQVTNASQKKYWQDSDKWNTNYSATEKWSRKFNRNAATNKNGQNTNSIDTNNSSSATPATRYNNSNANGIKSNINKVTRGSVQNFNLNLVNQNQNQIVTQNGIIIPSDVSYDTSDIENNTPATLNGNPGHYSTRSAGGFSNFSTGKLSHGHSGGGVGGHNINSGALKSHDLPDPGLPRDLMAHIEPHKPRKQFRDYVYDTQSGGGGFINYQATFRSVIRQYEHNLLTCPDDKILTDVIVQFMRPLETDRPFEAFNLVWYYLKWLRENNIEIKTKLFTLIIRSFERCHDPQKYVGAMLDIYKRLPARNSHATAAMIKAHGVARDSSQCLEYLKQYKKLPKHDSNERFNFVVYQAALDASILYLKNSPGVGRRLEATARWYIHVEGVTQCDEPQTRKKINPCDNPKTTHPHLFVNIVDL